MFFFGEGGGGVLGQLREVAERVGNKASCGKGRCWIAASSSNLKSHFPIHKTLFILLFFLSTTHSTLEREKQKERKNAEHVLCKCSSDVESAVTSSTSLPNPFFHTLILLSFTQSLFFSRLSIPFSEKFSLEFSRTFFRFFLLSLHAFYESLAFCREVYQICASNSVNICSFLSVFEAAIE